MFYAPSLLLPSESAGQLELGFQLHLTTSGKESVLLNLTVLTLCIQRTGRKEGNTSTYKEKRLSN